MISVDQAWSKIDSVALPRPTEQILLHESLGRTLGEPICADLDIPAFDYAAIDGFAVPVGAPTASYSIAGEILPGKPPPEAIVPGTALRVFTGSAVPPNAALVMVEDAIVEENSVRFSAEPSRSFVRKRATSASANDVLIQPGITIGAGDLAVLACAGITAPRVHLHVRISHILTGSELVPHHAHPRPGEIRDTNGPLLRGLLARPGIKLERTCSIGESLNGLSDILEEEDADVVLVSGGASVGQYDNSRSALERTGFQTIFHGVRVKPGKPVLLARRKSQLAFVLPGNPVSHFVCFHVFVRRAIARLLGEEPPQLTQARVLSSDIDEIDTRERFMPARATYSGAEVIVSPVRMQNSGDVLALRGINALVRIPANAAPPPPGNLIDIMHIL